MPGARRPAPVVRATVCSGAVLPSLRPLLRRGQRRGLRRELRELGRLAAPIVATQVAMVLPNSIDSMMLGRVSEVALAAANLGSSVYFALAMLPMGILMAVDALASQAHGAGDRRGVARALEEAILLAAALAALLSAVIWNLEPVFLAAGQAPEIARQAAAYLRALVPGTFPFLAFVALRQTQQAMGIVRPALYAMLLTNLVNLFANWVLIFGHLGFPALGVLGCGWATSIARGVTLVAIVAWGWRHLRDLPLRLRLRARDGNLRLFLRLGLPIGLHTSLEVWLFTSVALIMGTLGARELGGHAISLNLAATAFMVPLGISAAATVRVGNAIGRGDPSAARRAAAVSLALGAGVMSLSGLAFAFFPSVLARLYTDEPGLVAMAATLIPIAAAFQVFDGLQVVATGCLRGAAETRVPAAIAFAGYWLLALPLGLLLAFPLGLGPRGLWWGLTAGLASTAVALLLRLRWRFGRELRAVATRA